MRCKKLCSKRQGGSCGELRPRIEIKQIMKNDYAFPPPYSKDWENRKAKVVDAPVDSETARRKKVAAKQIEELQVAVDSVKYKRKLDALREYELSSEKAGTI